MSLLSTASRLNTANQLNTWNTSCTNAMNQAKQSYSSIYAQREAMKTNTDYTEEDIKEVDDMLDALNAIAKTLIAPEPIVTTPIVPETPTEVTEPIVPNIE